MSRSTWVVRAPFLIFFSLHFVIMGNESCFPRDYDGDGYGVIDGDCHDLDPTINPGAPEVCDGYDNNCSGEIDEGVLLTFYLDVDGDGYGIAGETTTGCSTPNGYAAVDGDCDDGNGAINPGADELCNGIDDDCDLDVDEDVKLTFYADADGDGFGSIADTALACEAPAGYVDNDDDCDDRDSAVFPGAIELCNGIDDDCDGEIDEGVQLTFYADVDADGFGDADDAVLACAAPGGYVVDATDCNDSNAAVNPAAAEVCNGVDDDCDGEIDEGVRLTFYADTDGDGYGDAGNAVEACEAPEGFLDNADDCDDSDAVVNPAAVETCNGVDDDCDGAADEGFDSDGDGLADCFDEEDCDGVDNDGNGLVDEYGVCETCEDGPGGECLTLWQAHAEGAVDIRSTDIGDIVVVTNVGETPLCLDAQVLYTSVLTQTMFFDLAVVEGPTVVGPGESFSMYYGSWTTSNGYYAPYAGMPAWWCVESIQLGAPGGAFDFYGEEVPDDIAVFVNTETDVDADGVEDHVDWAGEWGVQANYNIWDYQTTHAVLTVGKTASVLEDTITVTLTSRNVGYLDGSGVVADTTPYGYELVETSVEPASDIENPDGTHSLTFDVAVNGTGGTIDANSAAISYSVRKIQPSDAPYVELGAATVTFFDGELELTNYSLPAAAYGIDVDGDGASACP